MTGWGRAVPPLTFLWRGATGGRGANRRVVRVRLELAVLAAGQTALAAAALVAAGSRSSAGWSALYASLGFVATLAAERLSRLGREAMVAAEPLAHGARVERRLFTVARQLAIVAIVAVVVALLSLLNDYFVALFAGVALAVGVHALALYVAVVLWERRLRARLLLPRLSWLPVNDFSRASWFYAAER